jgi:phosphotransferase system enzyme I (PtsP)
MPAELKIGAMLEVPSLMWQLDELMAEVDFVSVGSNDLFQFVMAVDRGNPRIAGRFDPLSRPFLRVLRQIVLKAEEHARPLTLCGELAGRPLPALALAGIGFRSLSMASSAIGPVKAMLRELDLGKLERLLIPAIAEPIGGQTIRELLIDFADSHGIHY